MTQKEADEAVIFLEEQLKRENPDTSPELLHSLARLGASIARKSTKKTAVKPDIIEEPEKTQLDFWEDGRRAAPNALFRSALFPVLNNKQKESRKFIKEEKIFSTGGLDVVFTGEQLDQSDLDVYLELLNFARPFPLGTPIKFSAYSLLKALGLTTGGENHSRMHSVLIRLCGAVIDITDHNKRYFGQLIHGGVRDEVTKEYEITINPKFAVLFGLGMWATIDKEQRQALGRNSLSKALHAYYSSHANPSAHKFSTLAEITGVKNSNKRQLKSSLIKAHEPLKDIGFLLDYETTSETIKAIINHSPTQIRHIIKKAKANKKKSSTDQPPEK